MSGPVAFVGEVRLAASVVRAPADWSPDLTTAYTAEAAPSAASCNSAIVELVAIADRIVAGSAMIDAGEWRTTRLADTNPDTGMPRTQAMVGYWLSDADLTPRNDRSLYALALAQVAREIHAGQATAPAPPPADRPGGWVAVLIEAGAVICVGLAVDYLVNHASTLIQNVRRDHEVIAQVGRDYSEQLRVQVATGTMPPPSDLQVASAALVRAAADRGRDAGIGQHVDRAVSSLSKAAFGVGVAWVVAEAVKGALSGSK